MVDDVLGPSIGFRRRATSVRHALSPALPSTQRWTCCCPSLNRTSVLPCYIISQSSTLAHLLALCQNYGHGLVLRPNSHAFCQPTRSWITLTSRQASSSTQHEETQFDPMEHISQEMTRYLSSGGGSSGEAALSEAMSLSFAGITLLPLPSNGSARIPDRWKPVFTHDENGKGFWDRTDAEAGEDNAEAREIDGVGAMITWVDEKDLIRSADDARPVPSSFKNSRVTERDCFSLTVDATDDDHDPSLRRPRPRSCRTSPAVHSPAFGADSFRLFEGRSSRRTERRAKAVERVVDEDRKSLVRLCPFCRRIVDHPESLFQPSSWPFSSAIAS